MGDTRTPHAAWPDATHRQRHERTFYNGSGACSSRTVDSDSVGGLLGRIVRRANGAPMMG